MNDSDRNIIRDLIYEGCENSHDCDDSEPWAMHHSTCPKSNLYDDTIDVVDSSTMTTDTDERTFQILAERSSRDPAKLRWFEVTIERSTNIDHLPTMYRLTTIGRTLYPNEVDHERTVATSSANGVIDMLAMMNRETGRPYIPKVSRLALLEAAEFDDPLGEALDDFDTMHS